MSVARVASHSPAPLASPVIADAGSRALGASSPGPPRRLPAPAPTPSSISITPAAEAAFPSSFATNASPGSGAARATPPKEPTSPVAPHLATGNHRRRSPRRERLLNNLLLQRRRPLPTRIRPTRLLGVHLAAGGHFGSLLVHAALCAPPARTRQAAACTELHRPHRTLTVSA